MVDIMINSDDMFDMLIYIYIYIYKQWYQYWSILEENKVLLFLDEIRLISKGLQMLFCYWNHCWKAMFPHDFAFHCFKISRTSLISFHLVPISIRSLSLEIPWKPLKKTSFPNGFHSHGNGWLRPRGSAGLPALAGPGDPNSCVSRVFIRSQSQVFSMIRSNSSTCFGLSPGSPGSGSRGRGPMWKWLQMDR